MFSPLNALFSALHDMRRTSPGHPTVRPQKGLPTPLDGRSVVQRRRQQQQQQREDENAGTMRRYNCRDTGRPDGCVKNQGRVELSRSPSEPSQIQFLSWTPHTRSFVPLLLADPFKAHIKQRSVAGSWQIQHRASYTLALRPLGPTVEMTDGDWSLAGSYFPSILVYSG